MSHRRYLLTTRLSLALGKIKETKMDEVYGLLYRVGQQAQNSRRIRDFYRELNHLTLDAQQTSGKPITSEETLQGITLADKLHDYLSVHDSLSLLDVSGLDSDMRDGIPRVKVTRKESREIGKSIRRMRHLEYVFLRNYEFKNS